LRCVACFNLRRLQGEAFVTRVDCRGYFAKFSKEKFKSSNAKWLLKWKET
jgi:hypothetical protein